MSKQTFTTTFAGNPLVVEVGQVAKQANGATVVRYGESTVLTAAVMSKKMATGDFFPLQVNYEEKMYAAGKFPGGFMKREGRPSTDATLTARLIDRPIRPMFAEGFRNEVQVTTLFFLMMKMLALQWQRCLAHLWPCPSQIFHLMDRLQVFKLAILMASSSSTQIKNKWKRHS